MFSKFCKASLGISAALTLTTQTQFFSNLAFTEPKDKEEKNRRLAQLLAEHHKNRPKTSQRPLERRREPRQFFERTGLESFSKIALFHLVGFIGYLPYLNTALSYLVLPALPFNLASDGILYYMSLNQKKSFEFQDKSWTLKEWCKIADYTSYAYGFLSAGGVAKSIPAFLGMMTSLYVYSIFTSRDRFNMNEFVLTGALGATVPMYLLSHSLSFYVRGWKKIPFTLGVFLFYGMFSSRIYGLMNDFLNQENVEVIPSDILSSYKWSSVFMSSILSCFGHEEAVASE